MSQVRHEAGYRDGREMGSETASQRDLPAMPELAAKLLLLRALVFGLMAIAVFVAS